MAITLQQFKDRKNYIGGSDCAAIFGKSKWATPLDIFFSKVQDNEEIDELNESIVWGNRLEDDIIDAFEMATTKKCKAEPNTIYHPQYPFIAANIDAKIVGENAILEAKTSRLPDEWGERGSDQIPDAYLFQVAHYSAVLNLDKVYIAVLIGASDFRLYEYIKNPKLEDIIIKKVVQFWNDHIVTMTPPPVLTPDDARQLWPVAEPAIHKVASYDILNDLHDIHQMRTQIKELEKKCKMKIASILSYMENAELLKDLNGQDLVTWKNQNAKRFDLKTFKEENSELYNKYVKTTSSRIMRIKGESQ